jgi:hypothetical protein
MTVGLSGTADAVLAGAAVNIPITKIEAAVLRLFFIGFPVSCWPAA